jgi:hypothetical protein
VVLVVCGTALDAFPTIQRAGMAIAVLWICVSDFYAVRGLGRWRPRQLPA